MRLDSCILLKQRSIYYNSAKRLYAKLIDLYLSPDISKEHHRSQIDSTSYDYEKKISEFDKVPNDSYAYGIIKIHECLDAKDLVHQFQHQRRFSNGQQVCDRTSVGYNKLFQNHFLTHDKPSSPKRDLEKLNVKSTRNEPFTPNQPSFRNPVSKQWIKALFVKGKSDAKNINHWLEGKGKSYQSGRFSQEEIKFAYESYLNMSQTKSSSSLEPNPSV